MTVEPTPRASYGQTEALALAIVDDETLLAGLDPILAAHVVERLEADPHLRGPLAVAALGRAWGWGDQ